MSVEFVLSDIDDKELLDDNVYDVFEPTLKLQIHGRDVLDALGIDGIMKVVVMHFMESALKVTQRMIADLATHPTGEYKYWFLGTGYGLLVKKRGEILEVSIETNPGMGPVVQGNLTHETHVLGEVSVQDWVRSIIVLCKQLIDRITVANPKFKQFLTGLERERTPLENWISVLDSSKH